MLAQDFVCVTSGGEDGWTEGGVVLRSAVHWQQRLQHVAETQQEGQPRLDQSFLF